MSLESSPGIDQPSRERAFGPAFAGAVAAVALVVLVAAVGVALGRSTKSSSGSPSTITVTGSGSVMGTPDTVTVQLGVQTTASSATLALRENSARVAALIHSLITSGVKSKDMATSGLNLWEDTNSSGQVTGFTVQNELTVTIHHLKKAGTAIDAAANAVGNGIQLNGVTLSISNDSAYLAAARAKAMRNAKTAASQIAAAGGTHVGGIVTIVDEENSNSYVYPIFATATANASALKSVPIQAGTQSVSVQVKVVFAL
ncbi:MAG: SIMPL domain-containing protein [Acidimicrobiales bacterium]